MRTKNVEHYIIFSDLLIINSSESFTIGAKYWYENSDTTDLRIQIINFMREDTGRSKIKVPRAGRTTRQKRKLANQLPSQITSKKESE